MVVNDLEERAVFNELSRGFEVAVVLLGDVREAELGRGDDLLSSGHLHLGELHGEGRVFQVVRLASDGH